MPETAAYESWRVEVELAADVWTDITPYVDSITSPVSHQSGRPGVFDSPQPSTLTITLTNPDHRFTFGNVSSPYSPGWTLGARIRLYELVGPVRVDHLTGQMELPEDQDWAEAGVDQVVTVSVVDRITRLDTSPEMISTLAEHIRSGSGLQAYYPLNEPAGASTVAGAIGANPPAGTLSSSPFVGLGNANADLPTLLQFGAGANIPGDDLTPLLAAAVVDGTGAQAHVTGQINITLGAPISFTSSQVLTLVAWTKLDATLMPDANQVLVQATGPDCSWTLGRNLYSPAFSDLGEWRLSTTGYSVELLGAITPVEVYQLVAARYRLSTAAGSQELWVGSTRVSSAAPSGSPPSSTTITGMVIGRWWRGSIAHVQLYVGTDGGADDYSWDRHLAQQEIGMTAHAGQLPGQRIALIAGYAGLTDADLDLDPGTSPMSVVTLAGRSPRDVIDEAVTTEQGRLHTTGDRLVFHDRSTILNI